MDIITENIYEIIGVALIAFELIVRLTPTEKDNSIYNLVKRIVDALIPNKKNGGGKH